MSRLIDFVVVFVFVFTLLLDQTRLIHDRSTVKLNFIFFFVLRYKLLLYVTSKVVSNVTKSSASDDLLHVNCNVTNRTQTCFQSMQIVDCLPGVWVLVLYWRPFYLFIVIVESLLHIFIYRLFCFRCSAVCFGAFLHRRKCCWLQIPLWYAVFNKVSKISLSNVLATQMGMIHFRLTSGWFHRSWCIVMFWVAWELLQFAATQ